MSYIVCYFTKVAEIRQNVNKYGITMLYTLLALLTVSN